MRGLAIGALAATGFAMPAAAQEQPLRVAPEDMRWVAPALAGYTDEILFGEVWRRRDLGPRDRSMATLSALIAGGNTAQLTGHLNRALDNGVKPAEIGALITHLAFYAGWPNAVSALGEARQVLEARGITAAEMQVPTASATGRSGIVRKGAGLVARGPSTNFIGTVHVSARFDGSGDTDIGGATVRFEAGARSAWHRHAMGQTLVVTEGCGWTQSEGGPVERVCAGDVVTVAPGEKHWHGATVNSAMTHIALSGGNAVEWLEHVTDAEYARGPR
ncbi:carboxymuconolactone decarboxylase family protein [Sphingomonas sp.]|uniref:(R)-mandelonitrile lyase n=1 Tax=Sphingomonas sp. TaxID=28214 RepID=UPI003427CE73